MITNAQSTHELEKKYKIMRIIYNRNNIKIKHPLFFGINNEFFFFRFKLHINFKQHNFIYPLFITLITVSLFWYSN